MSTNVYGGVKGSIDGKAKAPAGLEIGKPEHGGLGKAHKENPLANPDLWDDNFFHVYVTYDLKGVGLQNVILKGFDDRWFRQSKQEFFKTLLDVVSEDFYALEDIYDESGNRIKSQQPSYQFQRRQLGLNWALHLCYPYVTEPGKVYKLTADVLTEKKAETPKPLSRFEELVEDVQDALENWDERLDKATNRVTLIDGFYIHENGIWRNLKNEKVIDGRSIAIKSHEGVWETGSDLRKPIQDMWDKVEKGPKPLTHPMLKSVNDREASPIAKSAAQKVEPKYPEQFQRVFNGHVVNCL